MNTQEKNQKENNEAVKRAAKIAAEIKDIRVEKVN